MKLNIKDVAERAKVSKSTVSRVINHNPNVRESTRRRVLAVIQDLNYQPNSAAQSLASRRTRTIGLVMPDIADPYFGPFIKGAEEVVFTRQYRLLLVTSQWAPEQEMEYLGILHESCVDGVLVIGSGLCLPDDYVDLLNKKLIPVVMTDTKIHSHVVTTVNARNHDGAYRAVKHLLELGHREIMCVSGPWNIHTSHDRVSGFILAMKEYGIVRTSDRIHLGEFDIDSGYRATLRILRDTPQVTAVFYANDRMAVGGMRAIKETGLQIPTDISIPYFAPLGRILLGFFC